MKKLFCILLCFLILCFSVITSNAVQTDNPAVFSDSSGIYIVSYNGTTAEITNYGGYNITASLQLSERVNAVCAAAGKVVLCCNDTSNNQLIVYVYDVGSDQLDSFAIYDCMLYQDTDFCCDGSYIYLENHHNSRELFQYSYDGSRVRTYTMAGDITGAVPGYRSGAYIPVGNMLYHLNGSRCENVSGSAVQPPLFPAGDNVIASAFGEIYIIQSNRIDRVLKADTDYRAKGACVIGGTVYYPNGSIINGYDLSSGNKVCYYILNESIDSLYADGNRVLCVNRNSSSSVTVNCSDFRKITTNQSNGRSRTENSDSVHNDTAVSGISSDVYEIDHETYSISGIAPGTTVAAFRSNMRYDGYTLHIYRDNTEKKSGNVGTAMMAVFSNGNNSIRYELSVSGDLTGEGNRNSRDLNLLMDYMIGVADFNGVYMTAADLSGDKVVNISDVALLKRIIS